MSLGKNFDKEIVDKLKNTKLLPRPKWIFELKKYATWSTAAIMLGLGALVTALTVKISHWDDLRVDERFEPHRFHFIFGGLPWFLIVVFIGLIVAAYFIIKKTPTGYRYSVPLALVAVLVMGVIGGVVCHYVGLGERFDDYAGKKMPFYGQIINPRVGRWSTPETGRLSGMVVKQVDNVLIIENPMLGEWTVNLPDNLILPDFTQEFPIQFVGEKTGDCIFTATFIMPMHAGRGFFHLPPMAPMMRDQDCPPTIFWQDGEPVMMGS